MNTCYLSFCLFNRFFFGNFIFFNFFNNYRDFRMKSFIHLDVSFCCIIPTEIFAHCLFLKLLPCFFIVIIKCNSIFYCIKHLMSIIVGKAESGSLTCILIIWLNTILQSTNFSYDWKSTIVHCYHL